MLMPRFFQPLAIFRNVDFITFFILTPFHRPPRQNSRIEFYLRKIYNPEKSKHPTYGKCNHFVAYNYIRTVQCSLRSSGHNLATENY